MVVDMRSEPRLFTELPRDNRLSHTKGVVPSQDIRHLIQAGRIQADVGSVGEAQIQPASLDLRLGDVAHRVQASFLPGSSTVAAKIAELRMARLDLNARSVLEKGCVYIVPLREELHLPENVSAKANPKSTTGRLDIFTRLITDYGAEFETVAPGYKGKLYAEIVPRTFSVVVRSGMSLSQLRFVRGNPIMADSRINALDDHEPLVFMNGDPVKAQVDKGLKISVNLQASKPGEIVAFKAKKNAPVIDLENIDYYPPEDFWEAKSQPGRQGLILDPGDFYILASKERVRVPPDFAAEMVPFDPSVGEFRIHYAGFFDPGFGYGLGDIKGTPAVLEVRAHEIPFLVEDGQMVGRLTYMRVLSRPDKIYGTDIGSSYQQQGLTLAKQFKKRAR